MSGPMFKRGGEIDRENTRDESGDIASGKRCCLFFTCGLLVFRVVCLKSHIIILIVVVV